jgi:arginase
VGLIYLVNKYMQNYILPVPFSLGPYGIHHADSVHKRILEVGGASSNANKHNPSNLIKNHCHLLPEIQFSLHDDDQPEVGSFLKSALSMQRNVAETIQKIWASTNKLAIIGGDHSVAIGTGAGLSRVQDLSKIGMIWIDSHGDFNTPQTSLTKSITGYPLAINCGLGAPELLGEYQGNFLSKVVHIGARDIDPDEQSVGQQLLKQGMLVINSLDLESLSIAEVAKRALEKLAGMEQIWISLDVDVLDPIYFTPGETDVPVPGGMTTREILALVAYLCADSKVKVLEIVQLNDVNRTTPLVVLCSRILELFFGVGNFRYLLNS